MPAFEYMDKYDKMSLEEFYHDKDKPHTRLAEDDLIFKDLLHLFVMQINYNKLLMLST